MACMGKEISLQERVMILRSFRLDIGGGGGGEGWGGGVLGECLQKNGCFCLQAINQISRELNLLRNATCCNGELITDMC